MFLNTEMILSIVQIAEMQTKAFQEFSKIFDTEEARKQTEILMRAILQPNKYGGDANVQIYDTP